MQNRRLEIANKRGLHARAAAKFVTIASQFRCKVLVSLGESRVNGKSIMGIMSLAASQGTHIDINTDGEDEIPALTALIDLVERLFDEKA